MTKGKKKFQVVSGELNREVLVSVMGTNHITYFMFMATATLETFCKSLDTNGLMALKIIAKVCDFCLINDANFWLCKRFTTYHE